MASSSTDDPQESSFLFLRFLFSLYRMSQMEQSAFFTGANYEFRVKDKRVESTAERGDPHTNCISDYDTLHAVDSGHTTLAIQGTRNCKGVFFYAEKKLVGGVHLFPKQSSLRYFAEASRSQDQSNFLKLQNSHAVILTSTESFLDDEVDSGIEGLIQGLRDEFPGITISHTDIVVDPFIEYCTIEASARGLHLFNWDVWIDDKGNEGIWDGNELLPMQPSVTRIIQKLDDLNTTL